MGRKSAGKPARSGGPSLFGSGSPDRPAPQVGGQPVRAQRRLAGTGGLPNLASRGKAEAFRRLFAILSDGSLIECDGKKKPKGAVWWCGEGDEVWTKASQSLGDAPIIDTRRTYSAAELAELDRVQQYVPDSSFYGVAPGTRSLAPAELRYLDWVARKLSQTGRLMKNHCPFTVVIDTREQRPFTFEDIPADSDEGGELLYVPTVRMGLPIGDYSIMGLPQIAIERKSKEDLYGSMSNQKKRDNFENRLKRMCAERAWSCVVVEADLLDVLTNPPSFSQLPPKCVSRTVLAWQQRYPLVHWLFAPGRELAEIMTFRMLDRWHEDHRNGVAPAFPGIPRPDLGIAERDPEIRA